MCIKINKINAFEDHYNFIPPKGQSTKSSARSIMNFDMIGYQNFDQNRDVNFVSPVKARHVATHTLSLTVFTDYIKTRPYTSIMSTIYPKQP